GGSLTVANCVFVSDFAVGGAGANGTGGAISSAAGSTLNVLNTAFFGNRAIGGDNPGAPAGNGVGGAIENQGMASISQCTFTGNVAQGGAGSAGVAYPYVGFGLGGAVDNEHGGAFTISKSTFTGNKALGGFRATGSSYFNGIGSGGAIENGDA